MPTLSQVTLETRTIFKWIGIVLAAFFVVLLILSIKNTIFPAPPPPPDASFGKLPSIDFPAGNSTRQFTYSVDTISGNLPSFPASEKVYKIYEPQPNLLSLAHAQELAKAAGFSGKSSEISENVYQWKDLDTKRTLTMNILDYNFNLSSNFLFGPKLSGFKDTGLAIQTSQNILKNMNLFSQDLDESQTKTDLLAIKNYAMATSDPLNSQAIRVSFYQKPIGDLSIYYPSSISPMSFLIGIKSQEPQILEANFFHQKISDSFATYWIKTVKEALDQLKQGKAYISEAPATSQISIKKVSLGYYMSEKKQQYLMPIIVFQGDNFEALVSAVRDEWVSK